MPVTNGQAYCDQKSFIKHVFFGPTTLSVMTFSTIQSTVMLSVADKHFMPSVVMLNVVAPFSLPQN
jgi:hypothetical protein